MIPDELIEVLEEYGLIVHENVDEKEVGNKPVDFDQVVLALSKLKPEREKNTIVGVM